MHTNALIHETSPYLQQHAHNPVDWKAWNPETLKLAREGGKLVLVSIGYSSCHWCHVMEHESFEDTAVAAFMNRHFVCIKVDREERPDVDQVYMNAVQIMTGQGGWPLNCFTLPDGKPIYGGTYFPKEQWMDMMTRLVQLWAEEPEKVIEYATQLTEGVKRSELLITKDPSKQLGKEILSQMLEDWTPDFDTMEGGLNRAPKFPMPCNWAFLLHYGTLTKNDAILSQVHLTLRKMALGGIYDQVGGGFARYSVDGVWKVPHFEKMLYDNAQLLSLYAEAYRASGNPLYARIIKETVNFVQREMSAPNGAFYSAIDADSEGEEGKYYVWTEAEFKHSLGNDAEWAAPYFSLNRKGLWEHGNHILLGDPDPEHTARKFGLSVKELEDKAVYAKALLLGERSKRKRPALDDKQITSWNALMLKGLVDAYRATGNSHYLDMALKNAKFLSETQMRPDGSLWHTHKNGRSTIDGFLDDYAFTIEALTALYEVTFDPRWLDHAQNIALYAVKTFHDPQSGMFFFGSGSELIARKMELSDNVIPSSNSAMAKALYRLGLHLEKKEFKDISIQMLKNISDSMVQAGPWHANWADALLYEVFPVHELVFTGPDHLAMAREADRNYIPLAVCAGSAAPSALPLLRERVMKENRVYVCVDNTCKRPVPTVKEAMAQIE